MSFSASDYLRMFLNLLPIGRAWSRSPDSVLYNLMDANSQELNRLDRRTDDLIQERDPEESLELLDDYERDLGLPDDCVTSTQTISERRSSAYLKFIEEGGLHKQRYIDLASDFGWQISIDEFTPFWVGLGRCGDSVGAQTNIFYWRVNVYIDPVSQQVYFRCGSSQCGDALGSPLSIALMRCIFEKYKPAHTIIIWNLYGVEFSKAFSSAFNAEPHDDVGWLQGSFSQAFDSSFDVYEVETDLYGQFNKDFDTAFDVLFDSGDFATEEFGLDFIRPF